eukprot:g12032.t1
MRSLALAPPFFKLNGRLSTGPCSLASLATRKTCQTRRRTFGAYEEVPEAEPWDATSYEFFDFNTKNRSVQDGDFEEKRLTQESWDKVLALSLGYQKALSFDLQV